MSRPDSYLAIAKSCGITLCEYCKGGHRHWTGYADPSNGIVHWHERQVNRIGMRNFLKLVAAIYYSHNRGQPIWQQLYEQNSYAYRKAYDFGVRIPVHLSAYDRARTEDLMRKDHAYDRTILAWARRRDA